MLVARGRVRTPAPLQHSQAGAAADSGRQAAAAETTAVALAALAALVVVADIPVVFDTGVVVVDIPVAAARDDAVGIDQGAANTAACCTRRRWEYGAEIASAWPSMLQQP